MANIDKSGNTPIIHQSSLTDKVSNESPPHLPENTDKIIDLASQQINNSEFTQASNPQLPQLERPINVTEPDVEQVKKILGQTQNLLAPSREISHDEGAPAHIKHEDGTQKSDQIGSNEPTPMKLNQLTGAHLANLYSDIRNENKVVAILNDEFPDGVEFIHAGNIDDHPPDKMVDKFNEHTFVQIDHENVHVVGKPLTENDHQRLNKALNNFKQGGGLSPKVMNLLSTEGKTYTHQDKDSYFNSLNTALANAETEKTEDKSKDQSVATAPIHRYSSNVNLSTRTPEIKQIAAYSFKGVEVAALFTIISIRNFTENLRKANEESKADQVKEVNKEIRKDQIKHDVDQGDQASRKVIKDSLKLRYRQVIEEMAKTPDVAKPSQTV